MARKPEWRAYGDPRCDDGAFVPKPTLRAMLDARGIDRIDFARDLGIARESLSRMLSGTEYMGNKTVIRAAAILCADVRTLLEWGGRTTDDVKAVRDDLNWNMRHDRGGTVMDPRKYGNQAYAHKSWDECGLSTSWDCCAMPGDFRDPDRLAQDLAEFATETYRSRVDAMLDMLSPATTTLSERFPGLVRARQRQAKPKGKNVEDLSE